MEIQAVEIRSQEFIHAEISELKLQLHHENRNKIESSKSLTS